MQEDQASLPPRDIRKRFQKVNIEISNICNLQCSFCPEVIRTKKVMDQALFESVIRQVAPLTELVCLHLMGEPLVHPKFEEFVEICHHYHVQIFLVTNGILFRQERTQLLLHPAFRQVNFSLHSFHDNFPERDSAEYLKKIFDYTDQALRQRPDLYVNFRLWNLQEPSGSSTQNQNMLARIAEHFQIEIHQEIDVRRRKSVPLKNRIYLHFDTEFTWPALNLPILGQQGTCYGLFSHFGVLVDGTIVPCCLDKEGSIPLGRIQEQPLLEILNGSRAQALLRGFKENKLVEDLCQRCQYIERFTKPIKPSGVKAKPVVTTLRQKPSL